MTIDEFLTNVRRIQAADPRYRLGRDGSDGYCDGGVKADTSATRWQFHGMLTMFAGRMGLMQIGDSGDAVKGLQSALMAAGFPLPLHGADGNFGAETEQALRQFQQKSGLSASGAADAETLAALRLLNG